MKTIHVHASTEYDVKIGPNLLPTLGQELQQLLCCQTVCIVSDSNVWPIYGEDALKALKKAGFEVISWIMAAGEQSKNGENYLRLLSFLAESGITRNDCLIALGGGVVGDLTGFVAATYLRGIAYVQLPTTLLAMVDSSVGGKTAIDLPSGKNLAGAFYQPLLVLCDTNTLSTLPTKDFSDGCAEIVKYAVLFDPILFSTLVEKEAAFPLEDVISRCVELKRDVVSLDEYDRGARQALNLGHTIGHAIEKASGYTVRHGQAVSIGMCAISKAASAMGYCDNTLCHQLRSLLSNFGLPCTTEYTAEELFCHILSDKKRSDQEISLIFPATIGCYQIKKVPITQLEVILKAGL